VLLLRRRARGLTTMEANSDAMASGAPRVERPSAGWSESRYRLSMSSLGFRSPGVVLRRQGSPTAAMTVREEIEVAMSASTLRDTKPGRVTCAVLTNGRAGEG
jgi:hypothetical protein